MYNQMLSNKALKNKQKKRKENVKIQKSRKELRKEHRKAIKAKRKAFFERKHSFKRKSFVPETKDDNAKRACDKKQKNDSVLEEHLKTQAAERKRMQKLEEEMKKQRVKHLKKANEIEEKTIKKLEKDLKLNKHKRKSIPKTFVTDGLDYILEVCDPERLESSAVAGTTFNDSDSEFEKDLAVVAAQPKENVSKGDITSDRESAAQSDDSSETGVSIRTDDKRDSHFIDKEGIVSKRDKRICNTFEDQNNDSEGEFLNNYQKQSKKAKSIKTDYTEIQSNPLSSKEEGAELKRKLNSTGENELSVGKKQKANDNDKSHLETMTLLTANKKGKSKAQSDKDSILNKHFESDCPIQETTKNAKHYEKTRCVNVNIENRKQTSFSTEETASAKLFKEEKEDNSLNADEFWEDIYGKIRDKQGNVVQLNIGKYIPPYLRKESDKKVQELQRLKKQLKGLLNRLAEGNMKSIAVQLEELYMSHSRNDMNDTLTNLMIESLVAPVLTPERLIMEHAMLIAIVHANVGTEVGAHILQVTVKKFDELLSQYQEIENKEIDNVVLIISHLYNFKVLDATLMYDILTKLVKGFSEKEVELILLILKSIGFSLRKDDAAALKNFILTVQAKANEAVELRNNMRVKFMLDVLLALKNNNMSKIPNYDPSHSEHLKKILKGLLHQGSYITQLKISLQDILSADVQGRWWVIGSAWTGGALANSGKKEEPLKTQQSNYSVELLELARKQRMNTDLRRQIFCILMTAEDYLDASERLLRLGLKNQQEREIIYVVIHCCLQEREFNVYYAQIAQKFCDLDRRYQISIQCSTWDKLKDLESFSNIQITNLSKFLVHLMMQKCLPLSVLKVLDFTELNKVRVKFLRQVLLGVLLHSSEEKVSEVFQSLSKSPKLHLYREGLRIFIHHFLMRSTQISLKNSEMLQKRIKIVDNMLKAADSKSKFQM